MVPPHPCPPAPGPRARRRLLAATTGLLLAAAPAAAAGAAAPLPQPAAPGPYADGRYVVVLAGDPVAEADGSAPGEPSLKAAPGGGVDVTRRAAQDYRRTLLETQQDVARTVGASPEQQFTVALNGFSAHLSAAQAQELSGTPGVLAVARDVLRHPDATTEPATEPATTADHLGLTGPDGVWSALGGAEQAGRGVVVADLDTGLWPEHPSVAGEALGTGPAGELVAHRTADGAITVPKADGGTFTGTCETGEGWDADDCTTKVVGARAFSAGFTAGGVQLADTEPPTARDTDGHGTHTATTAVGASGVPATVDGTSYGETTGVAPAAALAVYKVCWTAADGDAGCATSDLVAAIDAAVADNVDVINYSIGGGAATDVVDPVELAFLSAASAGIFVSASAGNSGPGASTLDHASPWVTTVAAASSVLREGTVRLGDGRRFVGASLTREPLPSTPVVPASAVAARGATAADARNCLEGSLDPAQVRGKVVVCDRAVTARVSKSAEVERAGGVGMVLVNPTPNSTEADQHAVPTVHLDTGAGEAVEAYAHEEGATVAFEPGNTTGERTPTPQVAGFSSRGPTFVNEGDVLKPDVAAPGSGVLAGYSPAASATGDLFAPQSGTSMAAPHVTGLAALYSTAHPGWSPMAVKSALMTTARDLVDTAGAPDRDPFAGGAGFVDPARMLTPGLVYDSGALDWLRYLEGSGADLGAGVGPIDPSDLNQASIAVGDLAGTRTVTRSVTATTTGLYHATASVPGFDVTVAPSVLVVRAGDTKQFRVTFTRTDAPLEGWSTGSLTWRGADRSVRSPIALRPVTVAAPAEVTASGASGSQQVTVTSGVAGELDVTAAGLAAGSTRTGTTPAGKETRVRVKVPEGTALSRFDLVADDRDADLDLTLYRVDGGRRVPVASSASTAADERITTVVDPGTYEVGVTTYAAAPGRRTARYRLTTFQVPAAGGAGEFSVDPDPVPVQLGREATFSVSWTGLDPALPHLGALFYGDAPVPTVVSVG
ncbi:S8 family serine peptidase [Kineococcus sp. SYSU DK018]|uniref:S8 family serine peptidase n=1 Tax=Kineococcus sp. SYSU DK018 TaxID=3383139 RepID=UPI003D7D9A6E